MIEKSQYLSLSNLSEDIFEQLQNTSNAIARLEFRGTDDEEAALGELELKSHIQSIYISLLALYESLNFSECLEQLKKEYHCHDGKLTNLSLLPCVGELYSEVVQLLQRHYRVISVLLGEEKKLDDIDDLKWPERILMLKRILTNTPKIIYDRKIKPKNEAQVRKAVFDILVHVFPDTVREMSISQVTKTYKPDMGIPSIKTAIEYKFADNENEVKKSVGALYEDMHGYAGSEDWKRFYSVIYMTDAYFTQEQIMEEFSRTKSYKNWEPILVHGKGLREKVPS